MKLSKSEAGKLGAAKSKQMAAAAKQLRINEYLISPSKCVNCSSELNYESRNNKFCNRSCSAQYNNSNHPKRIASTMLEINCLECGKTTTNPRYCSRKCNSNHLKRIANQKVINGVGSHLQVKRYLIETFGNICMSCDDTHKRGKRLVMELEHKNGDAYDNRLDNCELLCPSCHSVTDTYKGKNKGNGRAARRQRYQAGKSY